MLFNHRPSVPAVARLAALLALTCVLSACSLFHSDEPAASKKKGWSILPWGGKGGGDATAYIEYQRTKAQGGTGEQLLNLLARNTHPTKTIEGQMRTTMETGPGDMKVDSQSFTLAPNEQKRLLVYPSRFPLTYEVTATFRE